MDGGFSREQTVAFYGMPNRYYSFDRKGVHFVVLDGNDPGGKAPGYKRFIAEEQAAWLARDLADTDLPCVVFSHQPLDHPNGVENGAEVREMLESARREDGGQKVLACFAGHLHKDYALRVAGIHYVQVNSASYYWLPRQFVHESYDQEIHRAHPWIKHTAPYREPLWAVVTLDLAGKVLAIEGRTTEWVGPSPWELGAAEAGLDPETIVPRISDRRIPI
jgi:hypothetical protein